MPDAPCSRLQGSLTALATPFKSGDPTTVDEDRFAAFVAWQVAEGTRGLVPCGTTGESPTLSARERDRLIRAAAEAAAGRAVVVAGTGTNSTEETIVRTRAAKAAGADAALVVVPYYNKPTQRGILAHYETTARAVDLPLVVYDVPGRTGVALAIETVERLAGIASVVGIKDATGDPLRPLAIRRVVGPRFVQLSGDDATAVDFNLAGGRGCISVVANVVPRLCADLQAACEAGDWRLAQRLQGKLLPLIAAFARETNPSPVKHALAVRFGWDPTPRLPLVPVTAETARSIEHALTDLVALPATSDVGACSQDAGSPFGRNCFEGAGL